MTGDGGRSKVRLASSLLFVFIAVLVALDIREDVLEGATRAHVLLEVLVIATALAGAILLWVSFLSARERVRVLARDLDAARSEAQRWREEARASLEGLGAAIERQFERWGLSPAEAEIALLLLKGLSHAEVASVRSTSERTVRHQALAVYRKAGLSGRAELSAYFLEDLLLPSSDGDDVARREPAG